MEKFSVQKLDDKLLDYIKQDLNLIKLRNIPNTDLFSEMFLFFDYGDFVIFSLDVRDIEIKANTLFQRFKISIEKDLLQHYGDNYYIRFKMRDFHLEEFPLKPINLNYFKSFYSSLYYNLLRNISLRKSMDDLEIGKHYQFLLGEWDRMIKNDIINVYIVIPFGDSRTFPNYIINQKVKLIKSFEVVGFENESFKQNVKNFSDHMVYCTEIPVLPINEEEVTYGINDSEHYDRFYKEKGRKTEIEIIGEIKSLIAIMHFLYDRLTIIDDMLIIYPWFLKNDLDNFKDIQFKIKSYPNLNSTLDTIIKVDNEFNLKDMYLKIKKLIKNENFRFLLSLYYRFNNDINSSFNIIEQKFQEAIIDSCTLLEYFFTRGIKQEISFRLGLNAALFISDNYSDFLNNFKFFRILYNIRSCIIHGGGDLRKKIRKYYKITEDLHVDLWDDVITDYLFEIKRYLDRVIMKTINKMTEDPKFLEKTEKNKDFFLETSKILLK